MNVSRLRHQSQWSTTGQVGWLQRHTTPPLICIWMTVCICAALFVFVEFPLNALLVMGFCILVMLVIKVREHFAWKQRRR